MAPVSGVFWEQIFSSEVTVISLWESIDLLVNVCTTEHRS